MKKRLMTKIDKRYLLFALGSLEMSCGFKRVSAFLYEWVLQLSCEKELSDKDMGELFDEVETYYWEMNGYTDEYKKENWSQKDWEDGGC